MHAFRNSIFQGNTAHFLTGASTINSIPKLHGRPEVIVTGRANAGKSSLLNAVVGRVGLYHTSKKAGRTRQLTFCRIGLPDPGRIVLVDAPGYGSKGKPEWGEVFEHFLRTRKELRRLFILFNAKNGMNDYDRIMGAHLASFTDELPFTIQPILTKVDAIPPSKIQSVIGDMRKEITEILPKSLPSILTSVIMQPMVGVDTVQDSILEACGVEDKDK